MSTVQRRFLPDRFRPRTPRRRSRRGLALSLAAVAVGLIVLPLWTVTSVEVHGGDVVPPAVTTSLEEQVGHLVPLLDLGWLHQVAATWPAASEVRVRLDLPGTVVVEVFATPDRGSMRIGGGWHAVAGDGRLIGAIDRPRLPELVGFRRPADRREAFAVARRIAECSGGEVLAVRSVTPTDFRVDVAFGGPQNLTTVHVTGQGTEAERAWCEVVRQGGTTVEWADARWPNRLVLREAA
ncbi:MAG: hypothetical protein MUC56_00975 [Thermoanaerobaculales bacterium]|jgi:hypothetical protein|nr:hypothetical protein [Thermoanaerobaculales bacterium]